MLNLKYLHKKQHVDLLRANHSIYFHILLIIHSLSNFLHFSKSSPLLFTFSFTKSHIFFYFPKIHSIYSFLQFQNLLLSKFISLYQL